MTDTDALRPASGPETPASAPPPTGLLPTGPPPTGLLPTDAASPAPPPRPHTFLGRLRGALRRQDWATVVLEVLIVVLGVVIGFQVNAWGAERAERAREQVLLRGLRADFAENRAKYERIAEVRALSIRHLRDLHALTDPDAPDPDPALFDSLLFALIDWRNFDPTVGRVDALLGSGQIALLRSDSLQAALASWPTVLDDMEENERLIVAVVTDRILPYLATRYPLVVTDQRGGIIEPLRPNPFSVQRRALLADLEFANLVEDRWVQTRFATVDGEPVRRLIDEILRLIDGQLDAAPTDSAP